MFIRFDMIHERVRRTDGQTDRHRITAYTRLCIASRGKNWGFWSNQMPPSGQIFI